MNQIRYGFLLRVTVCLLFVGSPGCSSVELSKIPKKPLPPSPPQVTELALELPPEGGPRRPVDPSAPAALGEGGPKIVIMEKDQTAFRTAAEQDAAVKAQLGDRFAFIDTEEVSSDQCPMTVAEEGTPETRRTQRSSAGDRVQQLTYYSYTHNVPVYVCLKEHQVSSVQRDPREGYQPEEGTEEIEYAIALARNDSRIAPQVQNMSGHAILTSPEEYRYFWVRDEAGFGDRVFWVTFSESPESLALYYARVDLTNGKVLDAGKEPGPQ